MPESSFLDIIKHDGQDIVKMLAIGQKLLVFKHDDLFIIDCSGEFEFLDSVQKGHGIVNATSICELPLGIYWVNSNGMYFYDGTNPPINISLLKLSDSEWKKIWNAYSHIAFNPEDQTILMFTRYKDNPDDTPDAKRLLIFDIEQKSFYYKSSPSTLPYGRCSGSALVNNKLFISTANVANDTESATTINSTIHQPATRPKVSHSFTLSAADTGATGQCTAMINTDVIDRIYVKNSTGWVNMNNQAFFEICSDLIGDRAIAFEDMVETECNGTHTDYLNEIYYDVVSDDGAGGGSVVYTLLTQGKIAGTSLNFVDETVTSYGDTPIAFGSSSTQLIGNVVGWQQNYKIDGTALQAGVWRLYFNRGSYRTRGVSYTVTFQYGIANENSIFETRNLHCTYITGYTEEYYGGVGTASDFSTDDVNGSANQATASAAVAQNVRNMLRFNSFADMDGNQIMIADHFTIGSLQTDGDGSITGIAGNKYFDITASSTSEWRLYDDLNITARSSSGKSGKLQTWHSGIDEGDNRIVIETKDYDFGQPNVRKKVYKAYVTYKDSDGYVKCYYQVNQSGTWVAATVDYDGTASTTSGTLNDSDGAYTRATLTFGTGANSIYSIAIKFATDAGDYSQAFEVNDISFLYRLKNVK